MRSFGWGLFLLPFLLGSPAWASDRAIEALADQVVITPAQAVKAAKGVAQGRVSEIGLKARDGKPIYVVEFEDDRKIAVDARTGKVLAARRSK